MKFNKFIIFILIVFLKTGNVLSDNNIFNVNNIEIEKKGKTTNDELANRAIKKGFSQLIRKILLDEDHKKLSELKFSQIKELMMYYQVTRNNENVNNIVEKINFNIFFDKDKIHNLFYQKNISYSEISNKELFLLPILKKKNKIYIFNQNFFYDQWNKIAKDTLIEFILPQENIEIIQNVNLKKNILLDLELSNILKEYSEKNLALVLIEDNGLNEEKIYFKVRILGKNIIKNINIKRNNLGEDEFYKNIIFKVKKEIINLIKSQNLIDIRTPSFLNAEFITGKKNSLVELNLRLKKIDLVEDIYIQQFNNKTVYLKLKYLGKLNKIIKQLQDQNIILKLTDNQWTIKII